MLFGGKTIRAAELSQMPEVISELIVTLDMKARGQQSPGYYGYLGPELADYFKKMSAQPHRTLMGRKTYELMNDLPEDAKDDNWRATTELSGYLFSRTLKKVEWPGLELVSEDMVEFVRKLKQPSGPELRILGSLSIIRQLVAAKLLDAVRLVVCPLVLPVSGIEPVFDGWEDTGLQLASHKLIDKRVLVLEYRPAGEPPGADDDATA
jgi:dihydrofolate reductase